MIDDRSPYRQILFLVNRGDISAAQKFCREMPVTDASVFSDALRSVVAKTFPSKLGLSDVLGLGHPADDSLFRLSLSSGTVEILKEWIALGLDLPPNAVGETLKSPNPLLAAEIFPNFAKFDDVEYLALLKRAIARGFDMSKILADLPDAASPEIANVFRSKGFRSSLLVASLAGSSLACLEWSRAENVRFESNEDHDLGVFWMLSTGNSQALDMYLSGGFLHCSDAYKMFSPDVLLNRLVGFHLGPEGVGMAKTLMDKVVGVLSPGVLVNPILNGDMDMIEALSQKLERFPYKSEFPDEMGKTSKRRFDERYAAAKSVYEKSVLLKKHDIAKIHGVAL